METDFRIISYYFGTTDSFLQFKTSIQRRKYFGVLGPLVEKDIWRFIPDVELACKEEWFSETDFPTIPIPHYTSYVYSLEEKNIDKITAFLDEYEDIESYLDHIKVKAKEFARTAKELKPLSEFSIVYKSRLVRVMEFFLDEKRLFYIRFSDSEYLALIKETNSEDGPFWSSVPKDRKEEAEEIGKLIDDYFGNDS